MSTLNAAREEAFDYVIVGSGAAGATVARVLADTGRSIAILEEGPRVETPQFSDRAFPSLGTLYREMGLQQTRSRGPSLVLQGRCVGGSTIVNSAIVRRMPRRSGKPGVSSTVSAMCCRSVRSSGTGSSSSPSSARRRRRAMCGAGTTSNSIRQCQS